MRAPEESRVYFDCAATAPFDMRLNTVLMDASWANANSLYSEGKEAARQLRDARKRIASALCSHAPSEIVFTSGGTESDNMGVRGLAMLAKGSGNHVIVSSIEHHAVSNAVDALKSEGFKVHRIEPSAKGVIERDALEEMLQGIEALGGSCALVCVQWVNNEIGTIQPVDELASVAHMHGAKFFCDAVQALGKVPIDLESSGIDAAAFSAHKIGAPKGCGILYLRRIHRIRPLMFGGGQESGLRSGTSNVPAACAFAKAIEFAEQERSSTWDHVARLRKVLLEGISTASVAHAMHPTLPDLEVAVPHIVSFHVDGLEGETIVLRADDAGFAISAGSACSSSSLDPSHVLTSLGLSRDQALGGVRISFDKHNTVEEVERFLQALPSILR